MAGRVTLKRTRGKITLPEGEKVKTELIPRFLGLALTLALAVGVSAAWGAGGEECLNCHGDIKMVNKDHLVDPVKYSHTTHAKIASANFGCRTCHDSVTDKHPKDGMPVSATTKCQECHDDILEQYSRSVHVKNATCGDCHNPHTVRSPTEISGHDMNGMCAKCHETAKMVERHSEWLPQAEQHIGALPCITCHSESKNYVITMYIVKREDGSRYGDFKLASHDELKMVAGGKDIRFVIDTNGDNYISLTELKLFNGNPAHDSLRLQGMMTPEVVTHNFQVLANRWDCSFCHASGPEARQTSYIALPDKDGSFQRAAVEKGAVLDALNGTPDFYMLGSTRNAMLDKIGLLVIVGGMIMPVGHGTLRFLTRKNRNGKGH
jgi:predicted CXXCH cytochrome family protein